MKRTIYSLLVCLSIITTAHAQTATFNSFYYSAPGSQSEVANPLIAGCYPDPSICRKGGDYYLVNSSFSFFPGVPIWHSTDLKHWTRIGNVLNRKSQLNLQDGSRISAGIYAPDIKYNPHNNKFYMITTNCSGGGNFFVTTDDPKSGVWSDTTMLPDVKGIDPSFLFDDDGKAYVVNNEEPDGGSTYDGHRAIRIHEFDWKRGCTVGPSIMLINGGVNLSEKPIWIEGPHMYHIGDTYYIMCAEGGTGPNHREVIFHSKSPMGPFKPCDVNPILTQMNLPNDRSNPVTCAGHADLVEDANGQWHAVFLAVRPYRDGHDVMGRETFMLPVEWYTTGKDLVRQPIILPSKCVITTASKAVAPTPLWHKGGLSIDAVFIRTPEKDFYNINTDGSLTIEPSENAINANKRPSFIGRWLTEWVCTTETSLDFTPKTKSQIAGLALFHDDDHNVVFGKTLNAKGKACLKIIARKKGEIVADKELPLTSKEAKSKSLYLKITGDTAVNYTFSYTADKGKGWKTCDAKVSANILSTHTAGGFTGTIVGIYAAK